MSAKASDSNYDGIQALRFVAAFLVVVTHATFYASERLGSATGFWWQGAAGVNIFFVISGFVMVVSSRQLSQRADGWRVFIVRRLLRIVPMYWLATTVKLAALLLFPAVVLHSVFDPVHIVSSYFFVPTVNEGGEFKPLLAVGWTLYFEMFFYAIFALALLLRLNLYWFVGLVLAACSGLSVFRTTSLPATMFFDPIVLQFFFGMLIAAALWRAPGVSAAMARRPLVPAGLAIGGLALLLLLPFEIPYVPDALKTGIPAAMVVLGIAWLEPSLKGRLPRWLMVLGDASYSLYLFHPLIVPVVPEVLRELGFADYNLSVVLGIIAGLVAGIVVHLFIERPLTRWLKPRAGGRAAPASDKVPAQ